MVKVKSSSGGFVNVKVKGIAQARHFLLTKEKDIKDGADAGVFQAANFVQQEVQEDIIGNRAGATKSVDTGRFGNSISVDKLRKSVYKVFPLKSTYPGTHTTTEDVARILEFGTSRIAPRRHFGRTRDRTRVAVRKIVDKEVNLAIRGALSRFKRGLAFIR